MGFVAATSLDPAHAEPLTLTALVERTANRFGSRAALVGPDAGSSESYADLLARSRRIAGGLAALGIGPGEVVAAQLPNGPEFVALYLAAARLGGALQTLHMPYREAELGELLAGSGARVAVALGRSRRRARPRRSPACAGACPR